MALNQACIRELTGLSDLASKSGPVLERSVAEHPFLTPRRGGTSWLVCQSHKDAHLADPEACFVRRMCVCVAVDIKPRSE